MNRRRFVHPEWGRWWRVLAYAMAVGVFVVAIHSMQELDDANDAIRDGQRQLCDVVSLMAAQHVVLAGDDVYQRVQVESIAADVVNACPTGR